MSSLSMDTNSYLERIGYTGAREPTRDLIQQLHRAHLLAVPFENLDIPLGRPIELSVPAFDDKIVRRRRGGFCYELNGLFGWLFQQLGIGRSRTSCRSALPDPRMRRRLPPVPDRSRPAMRPRLYLPLMFVLTTGCGPGRPTPPEPARLDAVARRYVILGLSLGRHDPNYVDAYYGPDSLRSAAAADSMSVEEVRAAAESLIAELGDSVPSYTDSLAGLRHRYLRVQLGSMAARARMLGGERLTFDEEARALYDVVPPRHGETHFDSLLGRLDTLLPGRGALAERYQRFRDRLMIPGTRVDTVFKTAIAACRARTLAHLPLPSGERFDLEYVKGTPWNAYNWYQGDYHSLIQVNLDFPIPLDRAVDLACHEGYPGHHVYNALLERALFRDRGWVEISMYPLFSPPSLIAEGSANFGIDMAFPRAERVAFERDSLFPLAGLDPSLAERNAAVRQVVERLNYARNEVARRYLDGQLDAAGARAMMQRYWLITPDAAAKTLRFIDTYRSYVINYNLGRDLVAAWVERTGGDDADARWNAFRALLSAPHLPRDLR